MTTEQDRQPASAGQELGEGLAHSLWICWHETINAEQKNEWEAWQAVADYVRQLVEKGKQG